MEKDLSVGGNATVAGSMTASSYKVGDKTYIDSNGINANDQKVSTSLRAGLPLTARMPSMAASSIRPMNASPALKTRSTSWTAASTKSGLTQRHWPT